MPGERVASNLSGLLSIVAETPRRWFVKKRSGSTKGIARHDILKFSRVRSGTASLARATSSGLFEFDRITHRSSRQSVCRYIR